MDRRSLTFSAVLVASITLSLIPITAQPSAAQPSGKSHAANKSQPPQSVNRNQPTADDVRGTDKSPLTVKVQPTPKTQEETAQEQAQRKDISDANWSMVNVNRLIFGLGCLQLIVFGIQAWMLKRSIDKMDEVALSQTTDMRASIKESTRSATSMEGIAASLAANVTQLEAAMKINREIAETTLKNLRFAITPHVSVGPRYLHCTGTPAERPRWYLLTVAIVNTCNLHVRLLSANAACVIDGAERGTGEISAQTIAPGRDVEILVTLQLTSDEIDAFESDGITIVQRVTVWLNHQLDGPFCQTFSQAVLCQPGRHPVLVRTTDYLGEH